MNNIVKKGWFQGGLVILIVIIIAIAGQNYRSRRNQALMDFDQIEAIVFKISPVRGETVISVKYNYRGNEFKNDFNTIDTHFDLNDKVLIKVSKQYPGKYIAFIRKE